MSASAGSPPIRTACRRPNGCSSATCATRLPAARDWLDGRIALAHLDPATGDVAASRALAAELVPLIVPLLRPGASSSANRRSPLIELASLEPPEGVAAGRYNLYRRISSPIVSMTGTWSEALSQLRLSR